MLTPKTSTSHPQVHFGGGTASIARLPADAGERLADSVGSVCGAVPSDHSFRALQMVKSTVMYRQIAAAELTIFVQSGYTDSLLTRA
jgi:hypothetical protein